MLPKLDEFEKQLGYRQGPVAYRNGVLRHRLVFGIRFRQLGGRAGGVASLHEQTAECESTKDHEAFAGTEMAGLHQGVVEEPTMLAMAQHVVTDNCAKYLFYLHTER